jgi:hypothetical protein
VGLACFVAAASALLVFGRTLLREAPLVRDLILELYGFDIDDTKNKGPYDFGRYNIVRKFGILVRYVRDKSNKAAKDNEYPEYDFWIVKDENRQRRIVHIKEGLNQDYILKNLKILEKFHDTMDRHAAIPAKDRQPELS